MTLLKLFSGAGGGGGVGSVFVVGEEIENWLCVWQLSSIKSTHAGHTDVQWHAVVTLTLYEINRTYEDRNVDNGLDLLDMLVKAWSLDPRTIINYEEFSSNQA